MEKPKIFIFSTVYLPMIGGAELAIKEITDRLGENFDFIMFTARFSRTLPKKERLGAIDIYRLGIGSPLDKYLLPFLGYLKARRFLRDRHPTSLPAQAGEIQNPILWGMMASYGSIAAYFLKKQNPQIPFLLTLQEGDPERYLLKGRLGLMGFWVKKIIAHADRLQVISAYLKDFAVKMGADFMKTDIVPNGADLDVFTREIPLAERRELRLSYNMASNTKGVITASRLVHKNAIDILIQAMARVPAAHLFIAGTGPEEGRLRVLAKKLNIEKRTHFLGEISHQRLVRYYNASHIFVRPSRSEGLGSAFLEAMAAGLAIVATPVGGIPDFLKRGHTGFFCEVDNPEDLAFQIRNLAYNSRLRQQIAEKGKKLVEENYSWEKVAASMERIFYRLTFL